MKLTKLLADLEKISPNILDIQLGIVPSSPLIGKNLREEFIFTLISKTDEFKDCDIHIMDFPVMESPANAYDISKDGVLIAKSFALQKGTKFTGKAYLYGITVTPKVYDISDFNNVVKNGCAITPMAYNPDTFEPKRRLIIEFNPSNALGASDALAKQSILDKVNHVLDNPHEYEPKGQRGIIIRGVFEAIAFEEDGGKDTI